MFVVKADTATDMRAIVVQELRRWMTEAHIQSTNARLVSVKRTETARERAFDNAAQFFEGLRIESLAPAVDPLPPTDC